MQTSHKLTHTLLALVALVVLASAALAQAPVGPGDARIASDPVPNDQKAGAMLIYNLYSSNAANPNAENTRINITNTDTNRSVAVHLFFVDGNSCTPADAFICLTPNQTASFLASDVDPGVTGYVVAVVSNFGGGPSNSSVLIGDEYVKLASGHAANLGAEALNLTGATLNADGTVSISFISARVLAVDNIPSPADGNDTLLVVNRTGGNLLTGASTIGSMFAILYDDAETPFSLTFTGGCQFRRSINNANFRVLGGGVTGAIPSGRSGWMKFWATNDRGILGAALNRNAGAASSASAFNGGHNLHKLTLTTDSYTLPVFPPAC